MSAVHAEGVAVNAGGRTLLDDVDVAVRRGELVAVVGPNGAGKSTLVAALAGDLPLARGRVELDGRAVGAWRAIERARRRAVLPQETSLAFGFTVEDVVRMGRAPWAGTPAAHDDDVAVADALAETSTSDLADRRFPTLSGGEQARVALARVLAQRAPVLLLDEPTSGLDVAHAELVLGIARRRADAGDAVLAVLHDIGRAAVYADRMIVLDGGRVVATGHADEVLDAAALSRTYGTPLDVVRHPATGAPFIVPLTP